jgi:hypothetical protein
MKHTTINIGLTKDYKMPPIQSQHNAVYTFRAYLSKTTVNVSSLLCPSLPSGLLF